MNIGLTHSIPPLQKYSRIIPMVYGNWMGG